MDVFQCPDCELRFTWSNELLNHISLDHPDFAVESKSQEDELLSAAHRHRHHRAHVGTDSNAT